MAKKPLIGITCNFDTKDTIGIVSDMGVKEQKWHFLADNYVNALEFVGGIPVMLPICKKFETVATLLGSLDGVLISGGNDVSPECYGEKPVEECGTTVTDRDEQDIAIMQYVASKTEMPLLGICRGLQVMNVALGGSLYQDLCKEGFRQHSREDSPMNKPVHTVRLERGTRLFNIYGQEVLQVNSYHHSAVKNLAPECVVAGKSEEGVVEAIERRGNRFFLAVQWHPEMMYDDTKQQELFKAFVEACRK